jgi:acetyltransferase
VLANLLSSPFGGTIFPVNPDCASVLGVRSYPVISAIPAAVELAIVATPAALAPNAISDCVSAGVGAVIIVSAGFREAGAEGLKLEAEIRERLKGGALRVIGPNSLGVMNPITGLAATRAQTLPRPGKLAFISESAALCEAILDWSLQELIGFSAFVSVGSMLDVSWGDLIDYFGTHPETQSIICYMESIGNARAFLSAAREVSLSKPIIIVKAGRTETGAKAAETHTGALAGTDEVLDAACRRGGVLRVRELGDLFYMSEVLAKQPRPRGNRLAIVTNAGAAGVLAVDTLTASGGTLAELTSESLNALNSFLPQNWSGRNPVDILGEADAENVVEAFDIVARDANSDGLLVAAAPQGPTSLSKIAEQLKPYATLGKPVLASFMGGAKAGAANEILHRNGIPTFPFPETAARAFTYMWRYSYNLRGLYETPVIRDRGDPDRAVAEHIVERVRAGGRTILSEIESEQLLAAYYIPVADARVALNEEEAAAAAETIGFPVVLKLHSKTVTHKRAAGGVRLSLCSGQAVRQAYQAIRDNVTTKFGQEHFLGVTVQAMISTADKYELIVGSGVDPQFGPVLLFGAGGPLVEICPDRAMALPPLNTTLARRFIEQTKIAAALKGECGRPPVDMPALEQLLVRVSQLVIEQPWIQELDINPLLAWSDGLLALDARVILHGPQARAEELPRPVIRPYPTQYVGEWQLKNGMPVTIRPIRPEDEWLMVRFHERLSDRSVYLRYLYAIRLSQRVAHERLTRICFIDYDREMALVTVYRDPGTGQEVIIAVGRLSKLHGIDAAECAVVVSDDFQRLGLGSELMRRLLAVARAEGIARVIGTVLTENVGMRAICKKLGFRLETDIEDRTVHVEIVP